MLRGKYIVFRNEANLETCDRICIVFNSVRPVYGRPKRNPLLRTVVRETTFYWSDYLALIAMDLRSGTRLDVSGNSPGKLRSEAPRVMDTRTY